ncbi:hypothetical protein LBMAG34_4740 [Candidatus Saccharibacteria bacterium]|nr:hypothetical protein LBMAG34_4740 [Candidatus Saccharibacteria bacterium]
MKKIIKLIPYFASLAVMPLPAQAQQIINESQIPDAVQGPSVAELVTNVVGILFFVVGAASVIVLIVAGIMFVVSAGNEKQTKQARDAILYAVVGLIISTAAFAITNFINTQLTK